MLGAIIFIYFYFGVGGGSGGRQGGGGEQGGETAGVGVGVGGGALAVARTLDKARWRRVPSASGPGPAAPGGGLDRAPGRGAP